MGLYKSVMCVFFTLLSFAENVKGSFQTASSLKGVIKICGSFKKDDWVVLDIDNVILVPQGFLFKPYSKKMRGLFWKELSKISREKYDYYRSLVFAQTKKEFVDPSFPLFFESLKKSGVKVFGLSALQNTSTLENLHHKRRILLQSLNIKFKETKGSLVFSKEKGLVLRRLIEVERTPPRRIIFVDDKLSNIRSVLKYLSDFPIKVIGIHYRDSRIFKGEPPSLKSIKTRIKWLVAHHIWLSDLQLKFLTK